MSHHLSAIHSIVPYNNKCQIYVTFLIFMVLYEIATLSNICTVSVADCFLDLNFVVDSSGSINDKDPRNWGITLQFIADVVRQFTIGPNDVQVAFVVFSHLATVEWNLTRYQDSASLLNAIRDVRYIGSITNLNDALYLTRTQVFAPGGGTRPNAVKVTIILTDGEDNVPEEGTPLTIANATLCKREGIRLIVIGVSEKVDISRLLQIVSSRTDYHAVDDFDALTSVIAQLQPEQICFPTPLPPEPSTPTPSPPGPGRPYRTLLKNIVMSDTIVIALFLEKYRACLFNFTYNSFSF